MEMVSNVVNNTITPQRSGPLHVPSKSTSDSPRTRISWEIGQMSRLITKAMALMVTLVCYTLMAATDPIAGSESEPPRTASSEPFLLGPPKEAVP